MEHIMKLRQDPFSAIKHGKKYIELRLYDAKRQLIRLGDRVIFQLGDPEAQELCVTVTALHRAASFLELFQTISPFDCGFSAQTDGETAAKAMRTYYTQSQEEQCGVLGIEFRSVSYKYKNMPYDIYYKEDYQPVCRFIVGSKWRRVDHLAEKCVFSITTEHHLINLTGGSVQFCDRETERPLHTLKGFHYLYTGDVNPAETALMALENGKHFYIFSLQEHTQTRRVTLPRYYEAIDVCGRYSEDGSELLIPVSAYFDDAEGYRYRLCHYETAGYTLLRMDSLTQEQFYSQWHPLTQTRLAEGRP